MKRQKLVMSFQSFMGEVVKWDVVSFFLVSYWWMHHSRLWNATHHVTFSVMFLNSLFLLSLSFYPISYAFQEEYSLDWRATSLYQGIMLTTSVAFTFVRLMTKPGTFTSVKESLAWKLIWYEDLVHCFSFGTALALVQMFRFVNEDYGNMSWLILLLKFLLDYLLFKSMVSKHRAEFADPLHAGKVIPKDVFVHHYTDGYIGKARMEAFSDGVFAIAATFQFLEINIPSPDDGSPPPSIIDAFKDVQGDMFAYIFSFFAIGMLWVNHYAILQSINAFSGLFMFFNQLQLCFVAILPFFFSVLVNFWETKSANVAACIALGTIGVLQLILWVVTRKVKVRRSPTSHPVYVWKEDRYYSIRRPWIVTRLATIPVVAFGTAIVAATVEDFKIFPFTLIPIVYVCASYAEAHFVRNSRKTLWQQRVDEGDVERESSSRRASVEENGILSIGDGVFLLTDQDTLQHSAQSRCDDQNAKTERDPLLSNQNSSDT
eukprot:m.171406 g.171406  ORF g.171406 m.171406 type:complete len:488 (-) comp13498_c2_seq2:2231-3694(-)